MFGADVELLEVLGGVLLNRRLNFRFLQVLIADLTSRLWRVSGADRGLCRVAIDDELMNERFLLRCEAHTTRLTRPFLLLLLFGSCWFGSYGVYLVGSRFESYLIDFSSPLSQAFLLDSLHPSLEVKIDN